MNIKKLWRSLFKKEPTIKFKCIEGAYHVGTPVLEARRVIPKWMRPQIEKKDVKFAKCPGMFDQAQAGYIIPAWCDIHIKANRQGVIVKLDNVPKSLDSSTMDFSLVKGLAKFKDEVYKTVIKIPSPWSIHTKPGYSAHVMPASFHSEFLDNLYVYPGIVDYDKYNVANLIITPIKECEFTIWAGEPLLQVIPYKREHITAEVGKADEGEKDIYRYQFFSRMPGLYRKLFHSRKRYSIESV